MKRYVAVKWTSTSAVRADTLRCRTGSQVWAAFGSVFLTASLLTVTPVMLLSSQRAVAQPETVLEEIIVTARKREENVLEIPESLATFSESMIEASNINGLEDIGLLVPNLYMSRRLDGFPNVTMRGLGGFGNTQGVGFYLDDVQVFSDASSRFGDFERIEVLKGPQGILYGGANIGGAVKWVTKRPDPEEFSGRVKVRGGEDNYFDGEISLNIPLGESWAARVFGFGYTDDSYLRNPNSVRQNGGVNNNDEDVGETEQYGVRVALAGNITERFSVFATMRYNELDGPNNTWNVEPSGDLQHTNIVDTSFNPRHERDTIAGSLEMAYEFDNFTVTSISSYTETDSDRETDLDVTQEFILDAFRPHRLDVLTQELRITSTTDSPLQWQVGGYYSEYERNMDSELLLRGAAEFLFGAGAFGLPAPPPLDATESALFVAVPFENTHREREHIAGFANFSYGWDSFEIAGGFRVDRWESERSNRDLGIASGQSDTEVLGRGSISYFFDDDRSMVYALVSQGFEPGDFNVSNLTGQTSLFAYGPEDATQVEIGYKGRLLNDRLVLTLAGFFIDYNDRQFELQIQDPVSGEVVELIQNIGDSEQWGLEGDLVWSIHDDWTLSAGFGYIDAEWDGGTIAPVAGADISGMTPPNVADWSATAALEYDRDLRNDMRLFGRLQLRYKDNASTNAQFLDVPGDDFPFWENEDFTVVDLGAGIEWNNWTLDIHVENLFDEDYYIDVAEFPNFAGPARAGAPGQIVLGTLEQPRRVVGSLQYRF